MKKLLCCLAAMLAVLLLGGLDTPPELLDVYVYDAAFEKYSVSQVKVTGDSKTAVVSAILHALELPQVQVVKWEDADSGCAIDFTQELVTKYNEMEQKAFLYSLLTTVFYNFDYDIRFVKVTIAGKAAPYGAWGRPPNILTAAEYKTLREQIAYPTQITDRAGVEQQIIKALPGIRLYGKSFIDPKELEWEAVLEEAVSATMWVRCSDYEPGISLRGKTRALSDGLEWGLVCLEEHVKQNVHKMFGEDYKLPPLQSTMRYSYDPVRGVFFEPPRGQHVSQHISVLEYSVNGNMVTATASYAFSVNGGVVDDKGNDIPDDKVEDYMLNEAPRALAVFGRSDDGSLCILSHHML